jgi:hypothetical protein
MGGRLLKRWLPLKDSNKIQTDHEVVLFTKTRYKNAKPNKANFRFRAMKIAWKSVATRSGLFEKESLDATPI